MLVDWQKEVNELLKKDINSEKINLLIARCPKCRNISLEYDVQNSKIKCNKCGFEQTIKQVKR